MALGIEVDAGSSVPAYQQICDRVVAAVASGELAAGARLPTVRGLAADLGLAVNTVAKAYRQLEAEGHVETRGRAGTVVLGAGGPAGGAPDETAAAARFAATARRRGLGLDEAIGLLRREW